jgi:hypothetical protein
MYDIAQFAVVALEINTFQRAAHYAAEVKVCFGGVGVFYQPNRESRWLNVCCFERDEELWVE